MKKEALSNLEAMIKLSVSERYKYFEGMGIPLSILGNVDLDNSAENYVYLMNDELKKHGNSLSDLSELPNPKLHYSKALFRAVMVSKEERIKWLKSLGLRSGNIILKLSPVDFLYEVESKLKNFDKRFSDFDL